MNTRLRAAIAAGAATLALGAFAPAVLACDDAPTTQPFKSYGDSANYVTVPGGQFADGDAAWRLTGAAAVEDGALALPRGSSATSPAMCVSRDRPTLRFFTRDRGSLLSNLKIEILYRGLPPIPLVQPGLITGSSWEPSLTFPILVNQLAGLTAGDDEVSFRFTALGGSWGVDGVYVDPISRR
jgi:hypothetical protein